MFSKQLERLMESVREGFDNLKSEIHSNNAKFAENLNAKIQAENSRLVEQIESNNKRLSETSTKQFREENEKLRAELSSKLERVFSAFQVQVLIWIGDSGSDPKQTHKNKFLDCQ
jgi:hemerythrin-like domain-containing protein